MERSRQPQRPEALPAQSKLKMHLRVLTLAGCTYRIVTLRPGTRIAFSTNFYHQTWHIVSSQRGSQLLARLLWGLSFQRQPGTMLLIHGEHLLPTPFEAERSDPFLLVPAGLTRLDPSALRLLKSKLTRLGPTKTIRWQTFGLDAAWHAEQSDQGRASPVVAERERLDWEKHRQLWKQERMQRVGGFIVYSAPPAILRQQALSIRALSVGVGTHGEEMDYHFLAQTTSKDSWLADGEVQIFADYMDRVASAAQARRDLLANPNQPVLSEAVQEAISRQRDRIKDRRVRRKQHLAGWPS